MSVEKQVVCSRQLSPRKNKNQRAPSPIFLEVSDQLYQLYISISIGPWNMWQPTSNSVNGDNYCLQITLIGPWNMQQQTSNCVNFDNYFLLPWRLAQVVSASRLDNFTLVSLAYGRRFSGFVGLRCLLPRQLAQVVNASRLNNFNLASLAFSQSFSGFVDFWSGDMVC